MKVSIMVLTYNRSNMLKQTIKSILEQTYKDFELLIIDNYSKDDTEKVVKNIKDPRIKYFKNRNGGLLAVNRNFAIKNSKGEYIAICDDDDLWYPAKLEKQIKEFEKDKEVALVCTNAVRFNKDGEIGSINKKRDADFSFEALLENNSIVCSSALFKKNVLKDVGYFDENPKILAGEDYELWLRVARKYKVKYIKEPLLKYRCHPGALRKEKSEGIKLKKNIYDNLLKKRKIDKEMYERAIRSLRYKEINLKIEEKDKQINFKTIVKTKVNLIKKIRLILKYTLVKLRLYNSILSLVAQKNSS